VSATPLMNGWLYHNFEADNQPAFANRRSNQP
jgi:hypothetical protein